MMYVVVVSCLIERGWCNAENEIGYYGGVLLLCVVYAECRVPVGPAVSDENYCVPNNSELSVFMTA